MWYGLIGIAVFVVSLVVSTAVAVAFLVRLPADYFTRGPETRRKGNSPLTRWLRFFGKNLLAILVIALGVILSLPGVPGQGILTILLGIMLSDFPGKQKLERKIIGRPSVLSAVNKIRQRFKKPALVIDPPCRPV
jgi:hypothetical protein